MYKRTPYNKTTYNRTTSGNVRVARYGERGDGYLSDMKYSIPRRLGSGGRYRVGVFVRVLLPLRACAEAEARTSATISALSFLRTCGGP